MSIVDVRKEFGAAIRTHRLRLGLSQESLAERSELHRTYITDVERGARNLSLESISKLARGLEISIGSLFHGPTDSSGGQPGPVHPVDLLLVEDDPRDLELAVAAFAQARLANRLEAVRDGEEALDYLFGRGKHARRQRQPLPHVVLLDLYLPKMHGLEVLRALKASELTRRIHVVVLTGSRSDAHIRDALRLGADAYIVKPLDFQSFSTVTPQLNLHWKLLKGETQANP